MRLSFLGRDVRSFYDSSGVPTEAKQAPPTSTVRSETIPMFSRLTHGGDILTMEVKNAYEELTRVFAGIFLGLFLRSMIVM